MRLADLNDINNIKLGYKRPGDSVADLSSLAVPTSYRQTQKIDLETDEDQVEDETLGKNGGVKTGSDVDKMKSKNKKTADIISMANSWSPYRNQSDIRRVPNTANLT
jgi:hypothetical protein